MTPQEMALAEVQALRQSGLQSVVCQLDPTDAIAIAAVLRQATLMNFHNASTNPTLRRGVNEFLAGLAAAFRKAGAGTLASQIDEMTVAGVQVSVARRFK